ncbi:hypothetical protein C923_00939 [Plasmodium falciparum UGT5.1]|uniref:Uncharacterized protein n=1 Tax=Plasmodium falciparum UGT5.1 TaxID=1237627 RepID=W7JH34_PLAFA|nr:hypothetical protein C923_00939 [Plasmodium falciparum UGT5.1]
MNGNMKKQKDEEDEEEDEEKEKEETYYNKNLKNEYNKIINKEEKYLNKSRISNILKCVNSFDKNVSVYEYENILKKMLIKKKKYINIKINKNEKDQHDQHDQNDQNDQNNQNDQNDQNDQKDYMCDVNNNIIINTENRNYKNDINNMQDYINNHCLDYNYSNYSKVKNHNLLIRNERTKGYSSDSKIYLQMKKKIKYSRQKEKYKELPKVITTVKGKHTNNKVHEEYLEDIPCNRLFKDVNYEDVSNVDNMDNNLHINNISNINTSQDNNYLAKEYITNTFNCKYNTDYNNKKKRKEMYKILYKLKHINEFNNSESNQHLDSMDNQKEKYLNKSRISNILKCVNSFDKNVSVYEYENILKKMLIKKKKYINIKINKNEKDQHDQHDQNDQNDQNNQNDQNDQNDQKDYMCDVNNNIIINTENRNYKNDINNMQDYINNHCLDYNYSNYSKVKNHNLLIRNERTKGYSSDSKIYLQMKKKIKYSRQKEKYKELPKVITTVKGKHTNNKVHEEYLEDIPCNRLFKDVNYEDVSNVDNMDNNLHINNISNINTSQDNNYLAKEYITNTFNCKYNTDYNNKKKRKEMYKILYKLKHINEFNNSESNQHLDSMDNQRIKKIIGKKKIKMNI